jgi:hypothetical protein
MNNYTYKIPTTNTAKLSSQYTTTTTYYTYPTATMSPTPQAFKQQVLDLIAELRVCDTLIEAIRTNRRLGTTEKLDRLQSSLSASQRTIESSFTSWRRIIGSRMDLGDESARAVLDRAIRDLQNTVQRKLKDVATNRVREKHEREVPGFGELWRRWIAIENTVISAIDTCGEHYECAPVQDNHTPPRPSPIHQYTPQPVQEPTRPRVNPDEVVISIKDLVELRNHMKNSWVERSLGTRGTCFVNVFDENDVRWERPDGFVKCLPRGARIPRPAYVESDDGESWSRDDRSSVFSMR